MSRVYIVVLNWNGANDTIECLESLLKLDYADYRIVVCDNGSEDDSISDLTSWMRAKAGEGALSFQVLDRSAIGNGGGGLDKTMTLIANHQNLGFGGGSNVGLRYVLQRGDADFCWLLNNDTVVETSALSEMVNRLHEKPDAAMCGSTLRDYTDRSRIQALGGAVYYKWVGLAWHIGRTLTGTVSSNPLPVENKMDYVVGASLLVRSSYLKDVGLMTEDYFLYFEELDWILRGGGRYTLAYAPRSVVYHKVGASIGTATNPLSKSFESDFYTLRNRIRFTRRFCRHALPGVYVSLAAELLLRVLVGRWRVAWLVSRSIWSRDTQSGVA